jgi:murein DD-endopeptidase MepM/ murein hydrolase activator NlpD
MAAHLFPTLASRRPELPGPQPEPARTAAHPGLMARLGTERVCAIVVAAVVVGATAVSSLPPAGARTAAPGAAAAQAFAAVGGPAGDVSGPRIVAGGAFGIARGGIVGPAERPIAPNAFREVSAITLPATSVTGAAAVTGPFLDDGTLLKPVSVDTTVADAKSMLRTYKTRRGDTLDTIARRFKVSPGTIYWANKLKNTKVQSGWTLTIPPVSGLVVTVKPTDTLASLAKANKITPEAILAANKLDDPNLVMGQVLVLPGARGPKMVKPKPKAPKAQVATGGASSGGGSGPARYTGGRFAWPVAGGDISRGFRSGHFGLDIAANTGTAVKAAAGGRVTFAGWKSNGGGYQVWISHGSGLFTTYNHMSSISVGTGQSVGRGQRLGGVGSTGNSTGPHLHFEVWKGPIWNGGYRVNPMGYL